MSAKDIELMYMCSLGYIAVGVLDIFLALVTIKVIKDYSAMELELVKAEEKELTPVTEIV